MVFAIGACDDDSPAGTHGTGVPSCASVTGKGVSFDVGSADWVVTTSIYVPFPFDTTTEFYGSVTLSPAAQITNVNAGDTLTVRFVLNDPLRMRAPLPPSVAVSATGNPGGYLGPATYSALDRQGEWDLQITNAGVYGATQGTVNGFWFNTSADSLAVGDRLYCLTGTLRVPASIGGQPIAANQTIAVEVLRWHLLLDGDQRGTRSPVYTE
jgi:hypothetical protein